MALFIRSSTLIVLLLSIIQNTSSFSLFNVNTKNGPNNFNTHQLYMSTSTPPPKTNEFNAVPVAKTGGRGVTSTSQEALEKNLSLGAPGDRPKGGQFMTRGGVQVTAKVDELMFLNAQSGETAPNGSSAKAIEDLVDRLDAERGVLLTSSYEFPGRFVLLCNNSSILMIFLTRN
jgi:hypothetical protein